VITVHIVKKKKTNKKRETLKLN